MKRNRSSPVILAILGLLIAIVLQPPAAAVNPIYTGSSQALASRAIPGSGTLFFIPNQGQTDPEVKFTLPGSNKTFFFTSAGVTMLLREPRAAAAVGVRKARLNPEDRQPGRSWAIRWEFVGADPAAAPRGRGLNSTVFSYFKGSPDQWRAGLPTYSEIVYEGLWPGVDLVFSGAENRLKYYFIVHPGADPGLIRLAYRGAGIGLTSEGELRVDTPAGVFMDPAPDAWQGDGESRRKVACNYTLKVAEGADGKEYGFNLGPYDSTKPLILDPEFIVYSGLLGGSGADTGSDIAVDGQGQAYVTGYTYSDNFPRTLGLAHQGSSDVFVAKVKADGSGLVYCGLLGGSGEDFGRGIAVDGQGQAYVTGSTRSGNFPRTLAQTHQGISDVFVAKVKADGSSLVYSGLLGGSLDESGRGIAVDGQGQAYVTGYTFSDNFPQTVGPPYQGSGDVFVAKVKADGSGLVYSGLLGGSNRDFGNHIAIDGQGQAYVTGETSSDNFPRTVGAPHQGILDVFVAKVKADGNGLVYSGFLGGNGDDIGTGIAVDGQGQAYVTGYTYSDNFPRTLAQTHQGGSDVFVAKVKADGSGLDFSGLLGGNGDDKATGIAVDGQGQAYVTGYTYSDNFPRTLAQTHQGGSDVFVAKVKADGSGLDFSGLLGGNGDEGGHGIAVDNEGRAYVTGYTMSENFPRTGGQPHQGGRDVFVAKVQYVGSVFCPAILR